MGTISDKDEFATSVTVRCMSLWSQRGRRPAVRARAGSGDTRAQCAGVVPAGRLELGGHGRDVGELPDLDLGAVGEPVAG
jgi:hypothetical protein